MNAMLLPSTTNSNSNAVHRCTSTPELALLRRSGIGSARCGRKREQSPGGSVGGQRRPLRAAR